jgi:DNA-binding response OmpR family regulator
MIGNTMTLRLVLNTNGKKIAIMIILVDDRTDVTTAYRASFGREGVSAASFTPSDFDNWFHSTSGPDLAAVEAFILGDFDRRETITRVIKTRTEAPAIALNDSTGLESTLKLFAAGVDDVVRKPVHAREIHARRQVRHGRRSSRFQRWQGP